MVEPHSGVFDFVSNISGKADVRASEDTSPVVDSQFTPILGTTGPSNAWYQSGLAGVPNTQITFVNNTLYKAPANENRDPIQASGSANVPTSESSITH